MEVDSQKRSDYLVLIQARLYGWAGFRYILGLFRII